MAVDILKMSDGVRLKKEPLKLEKLWSDGDGCPDSAVNRLCPVHCNCVCAPCLALSFLSLLSVAMHGITLGQVGKRIFRACYF